jgi:hypothetical protein
MRTPSELEKLIVTELRELRGLEDKLDQGFAVLGVASPGARLSFLMGLIDLQERTCGLERLIDSLNEGNQTAQTKVVELRKGDNAANSAYDFSGYHPDRRTADMAV